MACLRCTSANQSRLRSEIAIHLPDLNTPHVFVFPVLAVCLNCGFTEFLIARSRTGTSHRRACCGGEEEFRARRELGPKHTARQDFRRSLETHLMAGRDNHNDRH